MRTAFHRALTPARPHSGFVVHDSVQVHRVRGAWPPCPDRNCGHARCGVRVRTWRARRPGSFSPRGTKSPDTPEPTTRSALPGDRSACLNWSRPQAVHDGWRNPAPQPGPPCHHLASHGRIFGCRILTALRSRPIRIAHARRRARHGTVPRSASQAVPPRARTAPQVTTPARPSPVAGGKGTRPRCGAWRG